MTELATLHGGGYRLVLRLPADGFDASVQADLYGPNGKANRDGEPLLFERSQTIAGSALRLTRDAAMVLGRLLDPTVLPPTDDALLRDLFSAAAIRVYARTAAMAAPPDEDLLDRLGRLGDALLQNFGFGPPQKSMTTTPAAFTYLGQFLAHELTLFRTRDIGDPRFEVAVIDSAIDLKTVFDVPPEFPRVPPEHVKVTEGMALGETKIDLGLKFAGSGTDDLPRQPDGRALLFEPRNDQNLALSQTHVAVTRFAQAGLGILQKAGQDEAAARTTVLRHFQSTVLQDYLPRIVDRETWNDVMIRGRAFIMPSDGQPGPGTFFVPIEFSTAIFRFGHAMVRGDYRPWNTVDPFHTVPIAPAAFLIEFSFQGRRLTEGQLIQSWTTDWRHMLGQQGMDPIKAGAIGTALNDATFCLPAYLFQAEAGDRPCLGSRPEHINLARRTLMAGGSVGLPTGQTYAALVQAALERAGSPCRIPVLRPEDLDIPDNPKATEIMHEGEAGSRFVDQTPLWLYTLREAEVFGCGNHLGPLGSRIVAETLNAAIEASGTGMIIGGIRQPFEPDPEFGGQWQDRFDYTDLVRLAFST